MEPVILPSMVFRVIFKVCGPAGAGRTTLAFQVPSKGLSARVAAANPSMAMATVKIKRFSIVVFSLVSQGILRPHWETIVASASGNHMPVARRRQLENDKPNGKRM